MDFDPSRLRRGEVLAGVGAVLLLVFMFAGTWYGRGSGSRTGWQALTDLRWLLAVTIVCALALTITQATRRSPAVPVTLSVIVTVLGLITVLALVFRVLIDAPAHEQVSAYLGLLSALVLAYGGYASMRQEGIATRDAPADIPVIRPGGESRS
jgi:type II secretory pathway component PulM